jgi:hypothetical protein
MRNSIEKEIKEDKGYAVDEVCRIIKDNLHWLKRRLLVHSNDGTVEMDYVDARIDDLISSLYVKNEKNITTSK